MRAVAHGILKRNGYRVIVAQNAGEALLLSEKYASVIHMLGARSVERMGPSQVERSSQREPDVVVRAPEPLTPRLGGLG